MLIPLDKKRTVALDELRASEWADALTVQEFCDRNERLRVHRYGEGIEHWGWTPDDGKTIVASCDLLPVSFKAKEGGTESGWLLASVITPTEERGLRYASKLVEALLEKRGDRPWILFSDIGPEFYARYGFEPLPQVAQRAAAGDGEVDLAAVSPKFVAETINGHRTGGRHFTEDEIDWTAERFRAFAEFRDLIDVPVILDAGDDVYPVFLAVDAVRDELSILWRHPDDPNAVTRARDAVGALGLTSLSYWEPVKGSVEATKPQWPMVRDLQKLIAPITDVQLIDWW